MKIFGLTLIAVTGLALGCGTIRNVSTSPMSTTQQQFPAGKIVYGGVKNDLVRIGRAVEDLKRLPESNKGVIVNLGSATFHAIDVPISLIGDTVTLPVTIPAAIDRAVADCYFPDHNDGSQETETADNWDELKPDGRTKR